MSETNNTSISQLLHELGYKENKIYIANVLLNLEKNQSRIPEEWHYHDISTDESSQFLDSNTGYDKERILSGLLQVIDLVSEKRLNSAVADTLKELLAGAKLIDEQVIIPPGSDLVMLAENDAGANLEHLKTQFNNVILLNHNGSKLQEEYEEPIITPVHNKKALINVMGQDLFDANERKGWDFTPAKLSDSSSGENSLEFSDNIVLINPNRYAHKQSMVTKLRKILSQKTSVQVLDIQGRGINITSEPLIKAKRALINEDRKQQINNDDSNETKLRSNRKEDLEKQQLENDNSKPSIEYELENPNLENENNQQDTEIDHKAYQFQYKMQEKKPENKILKTITEMAESARHALNKLEKQINKLIKHNPELGQKFKKSLKKSELNKTDIENQLKNTSKFKKKHVKSKSKVQENENKKPVTKKQKKKKTKTGFLDENFFLDNSGNYSAGDPATGDITQAGIDNKQAQTDTTKIYSVRDQETGFIGVEEANIQAKPHISATNSQKDYIANLDSVETTIPISNPNEHTDPTNMHNDMEVHLLSHPSDVFGENFDQKDEIISDVDLSHSIKPDSSPEQEEQKLIDKQHER